MNPLLAVHISDNLLQPVWWLGGFAVMAFLMALGSRLVRDDEIPRIALLTAAFFIASLIHVRVGPASAHLLLNGLAGVVLGWRAAIAIPVAVSLQALLFGHGGFTTIGINSCVMLVPALAASYLFRSLQSLPWIWQPRCRAPLVAGSCIALIVSVIFSACLLAALPEHTAVGGLAVVDAALGRARDIILMPLTLLLTLAAALAVAVLEKTLENAPEFPLGLLVGELTVLVTVALNCLVLLAGGETNWVIPASILVVLHLPVAVVEGVVLGFAVGLLARVRPDILGIRAQHQYSPVRIPSPPDVERTTNMNNGPAEDRQVGQTICNLQSTICNQRHLLAFLLIPFVPAGPAWAHRLKGEYKVLPGQQVRVEAWFDLTGDSPAGAEIQVTSANGQALAVGTLDEKGTFLFKFDRPEPLRVVISAGAGHREELNISLAELSRYDDSTPADRRPVTTWLMLKAVSGIAAVAALAIFALAWRRRYR
jgi:cobalt/nickel transport system permease protein